MDLSLDRRDDYLFVRHADAGRVMLVDRALTTSFLMTPDQVVEDWPVENVATLRAEHVAALLSLQPELVLLGTGQRQRFPDPAFVAGFLRKGVGIEVMDNAAAARTYNLLAGEGRRVLAAFVLEID